MNHPRAPPSIPTPSCPRCTSDRTKFCYYNNYSVLQPRYFCKDCRRYWTLGGAIRNIPSGGTRRKRGNADIASSSSQILKPPPSRSLLPSPPPSAWSFGIGGGTFRPPISETMQSFNGGGYFNQTPFKFSPGGELGGVNMGFGGGAPAPPAPSTPLLAHFSPLDNFHGFGFPFLGQPQQQPPPATVLTSQNMAVNDASTILTSPNNFLSISRDSTAAANVVINDWTELNDMDNEGEPLHSYNPPSP